MIAVTDMYGTPRMVSKSWGFITLALGVIAMIFHAIRDGDLQIRRLYAVVGFSFIGLCGIVSLIRHELFLIYGWACLLAGLSFLVPFLRHETDGACARLRCMSCSAWVGFSPAWVFCSVSGFRNLSSPTG